MKKILIVDDDDQLRKSFEKLLKEEGYLVNLAASGEAGLESLKKEIPDLVILDVKLPGMNGIDTLKAIQKIDNHLQVIIMTAFGTTDTAIEATKLGAFEYIIKPFDIPEMLSVIERALDTSRFIRTPVCLNVNTENDAAETIIGQSPSMREVYKSIGRVSSTNATVLIRGESGTGKELVARAIYQYSLRTNKPFQVINCVAIPETLLESELFGYEKGAFTGAAFRRIGKIEQAQNGTVFLDEIGDMPISIQGKILRLLQEKSIERLGGRETIPVDVRLIAATNRNLEEAIEEKSFREDIYYRLKVVTIWLPPLRERKEDIPALVEYILGRKSREMGIVNPGISNDALKSLVNHPWPGNVRELSNTLQQILIFNQGAPIGEEDIQKAIGEKLSEERLHHEKGNETLWQWVHQELTNGGQTKTFNEYVDHFCKILITETLNLTGGNRSKAAKLLGLSRPTLHSKIEKYQLSLKTEVDSASD
ncbi:sigma-54 dependent transcriptional regulator [bacterium]|nr:sigma-54 dependent transcriptional regulator [bacterium]